MKWTFGCNSRQRSRKSAHTIWRRESRGGGGFTSLLCFISHLYIVYHNSDEIRCYRSDWPGLCLFCCCPCVLFLFDKFSNSPTTPPVSEWYFYANILHRNFLRFISSPRRPSSLRKMASHLTSENASLRQQVGSEDIGFFFFKIFFVVVFLGGRISYLSKGKGGIAFVCLGVGVHSKLNQMLQYTPKFSEYFNCIFRCNVSSFKQISKLNQMKRHWDASKFHFDDLSERTTFLENELKIAREEASHKVWMPCFLEFLNIIRIKVSKMAFSIHCTSFNDYTRFSFLTSTFTQCVTFSFEFGFVVLFFFSTLFVFFSFFLSSFFSSQLTFSALSWRNPQAKSSFWMLKYRP